MWVARAVHGLYRLGDRGGHVVGTVVAFVIAHTVPISAVVRLERMLTAQLDSLNRVDAWLAKKERRLHPRVKDGRLINRRPANADD